MLLTIAGILIVLWVAGLFLHLLGGFIHIILVIAVIFLIAHFLRGKKAS
ncbi:MAG: lmo0937 family membrane protein [Candidatus Doudnabacteria bacterium]